MSVLVLIEHDNKIVKASSLNTITAAKKIDQKVHAIVIGENCKKVSEEVSKFDGIEEVLLADNKIHANHLAENMAPLIVEIAKNYTHILAPSSTFGKNIMPRVAALLDVAQLSDIISVINSDIFIRPIYAGNANSKIQSLDKIKIITVRTTTFEATKKEGGKAKITEIPIGKDMNISKFVKNELNKSDRPELTSAGIIVSGGRGMESGKNFSLLEELADKLKAAIGASRAAVDAGFVPNDYQVGQTGKVVAPELYIAVGISGAIQHLAGMKDSKIIVAINKDEEAPIFQVADYGLVGDLFQVLPELTKEIDKIKS
ncbi:MAG: Electron transfer flavoprotein subunit alpha [Alphaproteobacteria bacterium MarineAlpha6_Bin1]|nr:MAG: Electron transfer flavoprotein subunit alpha [Alphaproteobacteria bacterium MarineAlpha6_Bin1]